ncbi:hypothetical protein GCM10011351_29470 [Paraliobacillus quinghaiensis]|uniref:Uncharacterized protein n=1 Tax=Paraliobacillus quinghaiensis TaxID=470815 RepID=A0A917TWT3_9BACI|nr:hypothetical protein GCM10011351_29470 [Paraliobacillus quinghaiensis]
MIVNDERSKTDNNYKYTNYNLLNIAPSLTFSTIAPVTSISCIVLLIWLTQENKKGNDKYK